MSRERVFGLLGGLAFMALMGGLLFGCAGRVDLPFFWAFLGAWTATMVVAIFVVAPGLIRERTRPGPGGRDYATLYVITPLWLGHLALAALDVGRYHWSDTVPVAVQVIALAAMIAGLAVLVWAEAVNPFFSSVIRIQADRGHHVITGGPYRYLRHPGYAVAPFILAGGGLVLGSWAAALVGGLTAFIVMLRTGREDRLLHEQLEGYAEYARKVRYRLFPWVW